MRNLLKTAEQIQICTAQKENCRAIFRRSRAACQQTRFVLKVIPCFQISTNTPDRPVNPIQSWFQLSCLRWWCWGVYVGYLGKCASVNISLISVTQGQCLWDTLEEAPRLCKSFLATLTRDSFQTQEQWWPRQIPPMASSPWDSTLWRCGRILEGDMTRLLGQGEGQRDEEGEG